MRGNWYDWDLSWIVCTSFGARVIKQPDVSAWSEPLLNAFYGGCWFLFWTPTCLYWTRKSTVVTEQFGQGRRLHCESGPACANEIENLYFWHGVLVPAYAVVEPLLITLEEIESEKNEEVRRVLTERFGWSRYITETNAQCVESRRNDVDGTTEALVRLKDGTQRLLCACRSTGRVYAIGVPREVLTCEEAQRFMRGGSRSGDKMNVIGAS